MSDIRQRRRKENESYQYDKAPAAIGPYSQGLETAGMVFVSGQIPVDPQTGNIPETIEEQTHSRFPISKIFWAQTA